MGNFDQAVFATWTFGHVNFGRVAVNAGSNGLHILVEFIQLTFWQWRRFIFEDIERLQQKVIPEAFFVRAGEVIDLKACSRNSHRYDFLIVIIIQKQKRGLDRRFQ